MQRASKRLLHTVTSIPVVIPCEEGRTPDGLMNFDAANILNKVRIVRTGELNINNLARGFKSEERHFLLDVLQLRAASNNDDRLALEGPCERLWPFITGQANWPSSKTVKQIHPEFHLAWPNAEIAKSFAKGVAGDRRWITVFLPQLVTSALRDVRLVLWWYRKVKKFTAAIFCPDLNTALFFKGLLGEIRICPKCETLFVPSNLNTDYCSPAHREAHRVARWRALKEAQRIAAKAKRSPAAKERRM
jgi:hypothetical protein